MFLPGDDSETNGEQTHPQTPGGPTGFKVHDRRFWAREDSDEELEEERRPAADKPTYVRELERRAEEAESKLAEYIKAYKEKVDVELVQFRERLEREAAKQADIERGNLVLSLLEVLDNLDLSLESARKTEDLNALVDGITLIREQFLTKLKNLGLTYVSAEGELFDPALHEAVVVEETDDPGRDGRITEMFKPGFFFNDRLLRPAMVKVAKRKTRQPR